MSVTITVAIVTARTNEQTSFAKWHHIRDAFLARRFQHKLLNGEFGALLACSLYEQAKHHVHYQLRALAHGTRQPDQILVVDRNAPAMMEPTSLRSAVQWVPPMLSVKELELYPETALQDAKRPTATSFGCSDKNTAIAMCDSDVLVMLDDCCLPSFGLVEAVHEYYSFPKYEGPRVMPLGHRKVYVEGYKEGWSGRGGEEFNPPNKWQLNNADANWVDGGHEVVVPVNGARDWRRVLGVWAMPMRIIREHLNGYNTLLDGDRAALDEELMERCDRFLGNSEKGAYVFDPRARLYEIEHDLPWKDQPRADWKELCPKEGWRAPGPDLKGMWYAE